MEVKKSRKRLKQNINPSQNYLSGQRDNKVNQNLLDKETIIKTINDQSTQKRQDQLQNNKQNDQNQSASLHLIGKLDDEDSNHKQKAIGLKVKQNNQSPQTTQRGLKDKVKQNQINIKTQTKQFHNHMQNAKLEEKVFLTNKQKQRLKLYFKHICQRLYSYPKNSTFDDVRNIYSTINMTQWMIFCKNMGLIDKFKQFGYMPVDANGVKLLSYIYKKYQDVDRRMNFNNFSIALRQIIFRLVENLISQLQNNNDIEQFRRSKVKQILQQLCLTNKKKFISKLRQMGIMCSQQVYVVKSSSRTSKASRSLKPGNKELERPTHNQRKSVNTCLSSSYTPIEQNYLLRHHIGPNIKIYKSNVQRRQSRLMRNLLVSNLNKIIPSQEISRSLNKFIRSEDKYLKQYFMKQENIKKGLILRLQNSKNKIGNKKYIKI